MAGRERKTSQLPVTRGLGANDKIVVLANTAGTPNTFIITVVDLLGNSAANTVAKPVATPANSTALAVASGTILWDSDYLYIAVGNNTLKRVALSLF